MRDPGIVRNRLKIESTVTNAAAFLKVQREFGSFDAFLWNFTGRKPEAGALSKELKRRGFRFVGPTICYALMQAVGIVNDHATGCFRRRKV
jgi:DNA-3-methyladenine glycosylase I